MSLDGQIIKKKFLPNAEEMLLDAKESILIIKQICGAKKLPLLVDFTNVRSINSEARAFYESDEAATLVSAAAGVTRSKIGVIVANFFLSFKKPRYPRRVFSSEKKALNWLKEYRTK